MNRIWTRTAHGAAGPCRVRRHSPRARKTRTPGNDAEPTSTSSWVRPSSRRRPSTQSQGGFTRRQLECTGAVGEQRFTQGGYDYGGAATTHTSPRIMGHSPPQDGVATWPTR